MLCPQNAPSRLFEKNPFSLTSSLLIALPPTLSCRCPPPLLSSVIALPLERERESRSRGRARACNESLAPSSLRIHVSLHSHLVSLELLTLPILHLLSLSLSFHITHSLAPSLVRFKAGCRDGEDSSPMGHDGGCTSLASVAWPPRSRDAERWRGSRSSPFPFSARNSC